MRNISLRILSTFVALSLANSAAFGAEPSQIVLDPSTLRTQLLQGNLALDQELKQVEDAKTKISLARAGLFPSINVSALFSGNFVISSVDFLLPFLIPSNWARLSQDKHLFEAEKLSYKALALNTYSSALALYFNVRSDYAITQRYLEQAKDLRDIAEFIQNVANYGLASEQEVKNALGNSEAAAGQASKMQAAMVKEIAALRQVLGLPLETQILFSNESNAQTLPPSDAEHFLTPAEMAQIVERSLSIAPERSQIEELVQAAQAGSWTAAFGWINSAVVGTSPAQSGENASFSHLQARGSISLGLGIFPAIELSHRNLEEIRLRLTELQRENTQILEGSILAIQEAQKAHDHFSNAEATLRDVYNTTLRQYQFGVANLYQVLQAHAGLSDAAIHRIQAELDLTLLRVTLHRTLLTDEFAKISNCEAQNPASQGKKRGGIAGWLDGVFGGRKPAETTSLLELCKPPEKSKSDPAAH
jgi:outer membrane protein TolC